MNIQPLDILIGVVLLAGIIRGVMTGAIRQAFGLAGTVVAVVLGLEFMHTVGRTLGAPLGLAEPLYPAAGFLAIFLVAEIVVFLLTRIFEKLLRMLKLSVVNRAAGGLFGLAKSVLILSVLFLVLGLFNVPGQTKRSASVLYHPVAEVFPSAWDFMAEHLPYVRHLSERFGTEVGRILASDE